jgi:hypothetical protein
MMRRIFGINIPNSAYNYAPPGLGFCDFATFHPASRDVGILRPGRAWNFNSSTTFENNSSLPTKERLPEKGVFLMENYLISSFYYKG